MRSLMIAAMAALAFASAASAAPNCVKGVACGNACIAKGKVCHITTATKTTTAATMTTTAATTPAAALKRCRDPKTKKFESCTKAGAVPA
jgi:hypothetical protein